MPLIHLTTFIEAPVDLVFDLSRSVDLHTASMKDTDEVAIGGTTTGLLKKGDHVVWQAKHLFKRRQLEISITEMRTSSMFIDEMTRGDFKFMKHEHHFKEVQNGTIMIDLFSFESPFGGLGKLLNYLFLTRYMRQLLVQRNTHIKQYAEGNGWKAILKAPANIKGAVNEK
ncbi:SRPBCC family protein [Aridibaculum aurantiacum]|uniref:SRPBCC family protein n=1 Tax=Aridibaculum aurantiacum TaxID=2810307 RepID=UPI001A95C48A|nr:SRPBCC family protein [Aridibaculum aurantiacum]